MKFENSIFFKLKHYKIEKPFGFFFLFETFFISEIHEGIHYDMDMIKDIMDEIIIFYGSDSTIGYISNRHNSFSTNPQSWSEINEKYGIIVAAAIISYNPISFMNATLEKQFYNKSMKRCASIDEAIYWISNLREFNKVDLKF